jgi:hypothetical protein
MRALEGVHDAARKLAAGVVGTEGQDGSGQREAPDAEALTLWLADAQLGHLEAKSRSWAVARVTCGMALFDGNVRQIEEFRLKLAALHLHKVPELAVTGNPTDRARTGARRRRAKAARSHSRSSLQGVGTDGAPP